MTSQIEKVRLFRSLHVPRDPLVLYNIWDAGSALSVARGGAKAIATGSWAMAAAQGYSDGEKLPLDDALRAVARIVNSVDMPVGVDFEGGYASDLHELRQNVSDLLALGVAGLNFEDQVVDGPGLYSIEDQVARLRAVREATDASGVPAFINARTDVFLKAAPTVDHAGLLDEALAREAAYAAAGADGFFVPGLTDKALIRRICEAATLPVNVMIRGTVQDVRDMTTLGVARVSFGPAPYIGLMSALEQEARALVPVA
ncbi:isocitrate lyase/PEP mutase family protein [Paracoccus aestuariivivens]|uniref:Isocitrate lyase/phosphoenolpyruvate mutase family protein n=1 Tax=Paracoccus aestuariivivens TaxID=1820333 RepID=A0A6L6JFI9_9RHOB|nr:isocitrate lyase/phosphoenolpyruvate mutase family protein [Paracoccus aestuariivivens]MTH78661.1 isocitrate lyase/phosphoenolpyruvate mutase family protein [Paracoccus aestuariivivens]